MTDCGIAAQETCAAHGENERFDGDPDSNNPLWSLGSLVKNKTILTMSRYKATCPSRLEEIPATRLKDHYRLLPFFSSSQGIS